VSVRPKLLFDTFFWGGGDTRSSPPPRDPGGPRSIQKSTGENRQQALVQFDGHETAEQAKQYLQGQNVYVGTSVPSGRSGEVEPVPHAPNPNPSP